MKNLIYIAKFAILFCVVHSEQVSANESEDSVLWRLSRGNEIVHILGVIHVGFQDQYPLHEKILSTLESASVLVVESAVLYESPAQVKQRLIEQYKPRTQEDTLAILINNEYCISKLSRTNFIKNIDSVLGPDLTSGFLRSSPRALLHHLYNHEIDVTSDEMKELETTTSVENTLVRLAIGLHKKLSSLDPEYWEGFDALNDDDKCNFAVGMFDMYNSPKYQKQNDVKSLNDLRDFWRKGLSRQSERSIFEWTDINFPAYGKVHHKWFNMRNKLMAKAIEAESKPDNSSVFVLLGIAHLGGENGVLELLKKSGFEIQPIPLRYKYSQ